MKNLVHTSLYQKPLLKNLELNPQVKSQCFNAADFISLALILAPYSTEHRQTQLYFCLLHPA